MQLGMAGAQEQGVSENGVVLSSWFLGAGDSYVGGFLSQLVCGKSIDECCRYVENQAPPSLQDVVPPLISRNDLGRLRWEIDGYYCGTNSSVSFRFCY